ncbi:MFS general substrate transporter [Lentithecium fluviatile CBS 122367]|uniref:MFS general substrate transporter n=1 Tax=Lentithecium fluviatile CBS 122367 TaxID=1168545 RepID=A0A6G1IWQ8_9PLEO|nr:MFS general substrate transporter [Lentithecium fluviatile CBS 122367]
MLKFVKDKSRANKHTPLLQQHWSEDEDTAPILKLADYPNEDPRAWPRWRKLTNIAVIAFIAFMSILSPLASSMFTPGIAEIAGDLNTILILTASAPNIAFLITVQSIAGFFGSIGIANGGGTISDMFILSERVGVFGWYLLGPLLGPTLGPTLGPLFGRIIVIRLGWRWIFCVMTIVCFVNVLAGYFFLRETYAPVILSKLKRSFENDNRDGGATSYRYEGEDTPTMSVYQALIFGTTHSIYTNMQDIYSGIYGFNTEQAELLYLAPGLSFLFTVWFLIPRIDDVYNRLTAAHHEKPMPEFPPPPPPLANIGAMFIPLLLFGFAWAVEKKIHWFASLVPTFFYGIGQAFAASVIAVGTVFRSIVGGLVPLVAPELVFGFICLALVPAPILFYVFGERIREGAKVAL